MSESSGSNPAVTFCATLVDQWIAMGVRHAVVSPGSRSTPLALAVAERPELATHVHHDERSASFLALGIGRATGVGAIVVTTSGTAAAELHPAVVEAHQACVPMLVCTADRPPELQGVHAPQTIDQTELYGRSVRWFVEPGPPDEQHPHSWRPLAAEALVQSLGAPVGHPPGPVHLNLAFREPLVGGRGAVPPALDLPPIRHGVWGLVDEQLAALGGALAGRRGLVVAGERAVRHDAEHDAIVALSTALGWPIVADHLSALRRPGASTVVGADAMLRSPLVAEALRPEVVLRVGGLLASRVTNEWLAASGALQLGLDRWGVIPDPDHVLSERITADVATVCDQLRTLAPAPAPADWSRRWHAVAAATAAVVAEATGETSTGEVAVARATLAGVPDGGSLVVSSSMPVRDLEWYAPPRGGVAVHANRGANGIDGVVSTAVGVALGSARPTVCLVGDVAFLHDTNALLGLAARSAPLCVVVVDNDGGGIFSFLPQATALATERFEQLFGTPHGVDLSLLAAAHGVDVASATDAATLAEILERWATRPRPMVIHVRSDRRRNVEEHRSLNAAIAAAAEAALAEAAPL